MQTDEPRVLLEQFEGPLDLLLHLIRRHELEISEIAVASVADQYLSMVREMHGRTESIDVDAAADFLVIAATLVELKSRVVAAPAEGERAVSDADADTDDPASALVRSLLEYRAYRDAADQLSERLETWDARYGASRVTTSREAIAELMSQEEVIEDLELYDLVEAFRAIQDTVMFDRLGEHEVLDDDTPIELHQEDLLDRVRREPSGLTLAKVMQGRTRGGMIGLFLAMLELIRQQRVGVAIDRSGGGVRPEDIAIVPREPDDIDTTPEQPAPDNETTDAADQSAADD